MGSFPVALGTLSAHIKVNKWHCTGKAGLFTHSPDGVRGILYQELESSDRLQATGVSAQQTVQRQVALLVGETHRTGKICNDIAQKIFICSSGMVVGQHLLVEGVVALLGDHGA
jgi:hypothetical protein